MVFIRAAVDGEVVVGEVVGGSVRTGAGCEATGSLCDGVVGQDEPKDCSGQWTQSEVAIDSHGDRGSMARMQSRRADVDWAVARMGAGDSS